ncbi:hypothetical protein [Methylomonas sp. AM2-LC]|uniref:hypothetical protein n=1 Tax=Methylomonas sp. AM2-LC TaxID=3153301 RepID=UPI003264A4B1
MRTCWNNEEDDALQGLPLRAQIIYLRGIRRYMDYGTRISGGSKRRISLLMLAEIVQEWINRQVQPKASKDSIRASIDQLKRAGLIERIPDPDYLIFFLPKADIDKFAQNKYPTSAPVADHNHYPQAQTSIAADSAAKHTPTSLPLAQLHHPTHQNTGIQESNSLPEGRDNSSSTTKRSALTPYQAIVDLYHECLPGLPKVYKLNDPRRRRIKALFEDELDDLQSWQNYFRHISRSDFLMGRCAGRDGQPFLASFDFIIHPVKFIKIAEEQYHGKKIQKRPNA